MQKVVLVASDGKSQLVRGDPDEKRLQAANADTRVLPALLGEGWTIDTISSSTAGFLLVLTK